METKFPERTPILTGNIRSSRCTGYVRRALQLCRIPKPQITGVKITANKISFVNAELSAGVMMEEAEVVEYTVPLIDKDGGASGER